MEPMKPKGMMPAARAANTAICLGIESFSRAGIMTRWRAGYEHARRVVAEKPWECDVDTLTGIVVHESAD
jgi:hypothetical protein